MARQRILRYLQDTALAHPVRPYRMSAELLERLPPRALSERDRRGLRAWVEDRDAPGQALAEAMLKGGYGPGDQVKVSLTGEGTGRSLAFAKE